MNFYISKAELEKALKELDVASENGFTDSQAIFELARVDKEDQFSRIVRLDDSEFTGDVILRSHPTDPSQNWGRNCRVSEYKLVDGKCVPA